MQNFTMFLFVYTLSLQLNISSLKVFGAYSSGDIPVPIPNTEVKSTASMILGWRRPGKVDSAKFNK